jgi:holo-[acyl-carrier protein] synthase
MIVGVGIDVVEIARLASGLARTQRLAIRLFTERERDLPLGSLAARFALSHDGGVATAVVIAEGGAD